LAFFFLNSGFSGAFGVVRPEAAYKPDLEEEEFVLALFATLGEGFFSSTAPGSDSTGFAA
jgi:hypothetical protein